MKGTSKPGVPMKGFSLLGSECCPARNLPLPQAPGMLVVRHQPVGQRDGH